MNGVDWGRFEDLFHRCLDLAPNDREALLSAESSPIRREVEKLLACDSTGDHLGDVIAAAAALATQPSESAGAYRLVREIGRGGMGSVYLAVRADETFERRVAIKFVRSGLDSPHLRERFEAERRILARLEHPYIARLLDAGQTSAGQPYLVMEFVDGQTITSYARAHKLSVRDRISLFRKVCDAMQYAHQNLVVHRDLKPGNVLIDSGGDPKILDFGIAKLIDETDSGPARTLVRILTPDYASPEQVRGETVTTATDVYSLGAVLFELLAGRAPFHQPGRTPAETEDAVEQGSLKRPSECGSPAGRELRGDLDNIVLKAMRREPAGRYGSVAELSADLGRFLDGRPVLARDYTVWQRAVKFAVRHRVGVLASGVAAAALLSGTVVSARFAVRAEQARRMAVVERQRAEEQRQEATRQALRAEERESEAAAQRAAAESRRRDQQEVLTAFLADFYRQVRNLTGATAARRKILETGIQRLESLQAESPGDRAVRSTLGLAYEEMGRLMGDPIAPSLGDFAGGLQMLRRSAAIFEELHRSGPQEASPVAELATTWQHISLIESYHSKDSKDAFEAVDRAVEWSRRAVALAPADAEAQRALSHALITRVRVGGRRDASRMRLEDALEARRIVEAILAAQPDQPESLVQLAESYSAEADYYHMRLDYPAALPAAEKSLELWEKAGTLLRNDGNIVRNLMMAYSAVADLYRPGSQTGPTAQRALECYERMTAISERLVMGDPMDRPAQFQLAMSYVRMAGLYVETGDAAKGADHAAHSVRLFRGLRREMEQNLTWRSAYATTLLVFEDACRRAGRTEEVEPALREALSETLALAALNQRPESPFRTASWAAERLASWMAGRDDEAAIGFAEQSAGLADRARSVPGSGPFTVLRVAQAHGEAALLLARLADRRNDDRLRGRARALAARSVAAMSSLTETQMDGWSRATRDQVKAMVVQ